MNSTLWDTKEEAAAHFILGKYEIRIFYILSQLKCILLISTFISTSMSVRTSATVCVSQNWLQFLQLYHNMSLIKVAWYVLSLKNMQPESP